MAKIDVRIEDNSKEVLRELGKDTEKALYQIGLLGVEGCVEKASEIDSVTGRPTVDTGRYRAGFGFITPKHGRMTGTGREKRQPQDNFSAQRANTDTVIIANNVEYAPYLEVGSGTRKGGKHARYIMKRGIEGKLIKMKLLTQEIFEGNNIDMSVEFDEE